MSSTAPPSKRSNSSTPVKRADKQGPRVTRARVQAMESRASATPVDVFSTVEEDSHTVAAVEGGRTAASISKRRPVAKTYAISRALEYSYIRADMRRLIITASGLFVLMIVLLFILD